MQLESLTKAELIRVIRMRPYSQADLLRARWEELQAREKTKFEDYMALSTAGEYDKALTIFKQYEALSTRANAAYDQLMGMYAD